MSEALGPWSISLSGESKAMQETCSDRSPYHSRGVFTNRAYRSSTTRLGPPHRARMRREASLVALRRRSMQYPEYSVPRIPLLSTWVNSVGCPHGQTDSV